MSENTKLTVSASPHIQDSATVTGIMLDVIIALIPAAFAGVAVFGVKAALVIAVCIISCVVFEALSRKIMKRHSTLGDLSAVVTGLLLAFNLPVGIPLWMCVVGSLAILRRNRSEFCKSCNNGKNCSACFICRCDDKLLSAVICSC